MRNFGLFSLLAVLVCAAPASSQSEARLPGPHDLEEVYQAGYEAGYLDGYDSARGGDRLRQCEMLLDRASSAERVCRERKVCIDELAIAVHGGDAYLREVANRCVRSSR